MSLRLLLIWVCALLAVPGCVDSKNSMSGALPAAAVDGWDGTSAALDASGAEVVALSDVPSATDAILPDDAASAGPDGKSDASGPGPAAGTLRILHLNLPTGLTMAMGQSTIVVGPDGQLVLIDVGNGSHDDDILKTIEHLNTQVLTPANGYKVRGPREVEWLILTHYHSDHIGGFVDLLLGKKPIVVTRGIIHRGPVDLGGAANEADWQGLCDALAGKLQALHHPLCHGVSSAPCNAKTWNGNYPATDCPGLLRGDLATTADDASGKAAFLDLGGGARLTLYVADAFVSNGATLQASKAFGYSDTNEENGRCLGGFIEHGAFRYHFGGDLTGSGAAGEPDIESVVAERAVPAFLGPLGVDVAHLHHHARHTSSNSAWVNAVAPADGLTRNAVASINGGYLGSPHAEVVAAWTANSRLGKGKLWCTDTAVGGASPKDFAALQVLGATVAVETLDAGARYRIGPWQGAAGSEFNCLR